LLISRRLGFCLTFVGCVLVNEVAVAQSQEADVASFARQAVRIDQLETEIRSLTGQNENINFKIGQLEKQIKNLKDSLSSATLQIQRLQEFRSSAQSLPNGTFDKSPISSGKSTSFESAMRVPGAEKGAKALGVLRVGQGSSAKPVDPSAGLSPKQLYEKAQGFLTKGREFEKAVELLQIFVGRYPKHKLAPNAHYWLGRAYFVRQEFRKASFSFAKGLQKFPKSPKASANLLNLGMAFLRLGKRRDACTTWGQLSVAYPKAPDAIKRRVERERKKAKCL